MIDDTSTDIGKMNELLDKITTKRFISPEVFYKSVFAVCELFGIHVPMEELNTQTGESVFNFDNNNLYLYLLCELDEDNVYECYAQVINEEELNDIDDEDVLSNIENLDGETEYQEKIRHQGSGRDIDETPPEE